MSEIASPDTEPPQQRTIQSVRLAGFSSRDRELLRLFLRRPPGAGVSLTVVDEGGDLLIANALLPDGTAALSHRAVCNSARPLAGQLTGVAQAARAARQRLA